ncbi:MAG TPA: hypothetical protein VKE22_15875 [Haliangiales bacterium]|nr:hypothetical protein [Haliangiales bacterium]
MAKKVDSDVDPTEPTPVGKPPPATPPRAGKLTTQDGRAMRGLFEQWLDDDVAPPEPPKKKK